MIRLIEIMPASFLSLARLPAYARTFLLATNLKSVSSMKLHREHAIPRPRAGCGWDVRRACRRPAAFSGRRADSRPTPSCTRMPAPTRPKPEYRRRSLWSMQACPYRYVPSRRSIDRYVRSSRPVREADTIELWSLSPMAREAPALSRCGRIGIEQERNEPYCRIHRVAGSGRVPSQWSGPRRRTGTRKKWIRTDSMKRLWLLWSDFARNMASVVLPSVGLLRSSPLWPSYPRLWHCSNGGSKSFGGGCKRKRQDQAARG